MTLQQIPGHPCGWLVFKNLPEPHRSAEDATQAADHQRAATFARRFRRPATPTERTLLAQLGHQLPDGDDTPPLETWVSFFSPGARRRFWPALHPDHAAPAKHYPPLPQEGTPS